MSENTVVISLALYNELIDAHRQLCHLQANGVDNWEGYSHYSWGESEEDIYG